MHSYKQKIFCFLWIIFLHCCCIEATYSQTAGDKIIPNDTLKWEYYTEKPDSNSNYWANTLWNVYYTYNIVAVHFDTAKINLQTWHVLKSDSWVLKDKETDELLNHEQGHFNTAMICEAEFKKAIDTTTLLITNYSQKIDSVFNAVLNGIKELNVEYDKETNHMLNKEEQQKWDKKINDMIHQIFSP